MKLYDHFRQALETLAPGTTEAAGLWQDITNAYSGAGRYYHNLDHLGHMLRELLQVREELTHWHEVIIALCFHDLVYEPLRTDNEAASAAVADAMLLRHDAPEAVRERVQELIMATKGHQVHASPDINLFTDADLSVLGAAEPVYDAYAAAIRNEYAVVTDELYRPGRRNVLQHFLSMPFIYKTAPFRDRLEQPARINLERELQMYL